MNGANSPPSIRCDRQRRARHDDRDDHSRDLPYNLHRRQVDARAHKRWLFGKGLSASNDCIRTIAFQSVGGSLMGRETKNNVLQKALTLYLTEANVLSSSVHRCR